MTSRPCTPEHGGTINDVVLAILAGALRHLVDDAR